MSKNLTPAVRFNGFTDVWEQRKLGDVTSQLTKSIYPQNTPKQMYIEYSMPAYDNGKHPYHSLGSTISSSRKVLDRPCVLINKLNVRKKRVWLVVAPAKNSVSSAEFVPLASEQINLIFLSYLTTSSRFTSYLLNSSSGSSNSQKRVTPEVVTDYLAALPCKAEQQQIGVFFQQLDQLITLRQRKLELLQQLKKAMLQQMFPDKGESTPQVRFRGFVKLWARVKVGQFLSESLEKGHTGQEARRLTVKLWGKGIEPKDSQFEGSSNTQYYVRHSGQIMYGKLDFLHAAFGIVPPELDGWESTIDSPAFDVINASAAFLLSVFLRKQFYLQNGRIANGTRKAKRIHPELFFSMQIEIPNIEEQTKIASLLSTIDNLIALHTTDLDRFERLKKFLLQTMFV